MAEWLVQLPIISAALSIKLDVAKTLKFINERLQDRAVRKRQQHCRHSWQLEYDCPYSWCSRCQKFVPTESLIYLIRTGQLH